MASEDEDGRTEIIRVRCTPNEKDLIERLARHLGRTVSGQIRHMALEEANYCYLPLLPGIVNPDAEEMIRICRGDPRDPEYHTWTGPEKAIWQKEDGE